MQQTLLSMAFVQLGYEASIVDKDFGQPDGEVINNIRVWKTFSESEGIPVFRFLYPRLTSILQALRKADADVYYQSCAGMLTGVVSWFCKRYNRKFIFRTAHDTDCLPDRQLIRFWRDKKLYEYGLKRADIIAVQGVNQQRLLHHNYGLRGVPVNMAVEIPNHEVTAKKEIDVLWVNNMRPFKRPELAIDLAKYLSDCRFVMIGGPFSGLDSYYESIRQEAQKVANLDFVGPVPYREINDYFLKASVFVNTSETEGYPNSFLQAWVRGVPVVSFFDPDHLITTNDLGRVPLNLDDMAQYVYELLKDDSSRTFMGEKARAFAAKRYSPINVAREYVRLIDGERTNEIH